MQQASDQIQKEELKRKQTKSKSVLKTKSMDPEKSSPTADKQKFKITNQRKSVSLLADQQEQTLGCNTSKTPTLLKESKKTRSKTKRTNPFKSSQQLTDMTSNSRSHNPFKHADGSKYRVDDTELHLMKKRLRFGNLIDHEIEELTRWKQADVKQNRYTQYLKETRNNNDLFMIPVELGRLEKLQSYEDHWPCLKIRKFLKRLAININMLAMKVDKHKAFEYTSIVIIVLNCIQMAAEGTGQVEQSQFQLITEYVFLGLYSVEMTIKILSKGLVFNKGAYLRDAFNVLDFVIIMSGYVSFFQPKPSIYGEQKGGFSLNALRSFRVLRPLRSITAIQGLKVMMQALLAALPLLKDTIVVLIFFLLIMAIAGINLLSGFLKNRCVDIVTGRMVVDDNLSFISDSGLLCGSHRCPSDGLYYCGKMNSNPDGGVTNYDNIFWAFLNTFQNITLEGWSDTMIYYQMTTSGILNVIYFVGSVFVGAFFLLNLTLAVVNAAFNRKNAEFQRLAQEEREWKKKLQLSIIAREGDVDDYLNTVKKEQAPELGLTEYFIAKRAAKKMVDFSKRKKEKRLSKEYLEKGKRQHPDADPGLEEEKVVDKTVEPSEREAPNGETSLAYWQSTFYNKTHKLGEGEPSMESNHPLLIDTEKKTPKKTKQIESIAEELLEKQLNVRQCQDDGDVTDDLDNSLEKSLKNHKQEVNKLLEELKDKDEVRPDRKLEPADSSKLMGFIGNKDENAWRYMPRPQEVHRPEMPKALLADLDLDNFITDQDFQRLNDEPKPRAEKKSKQQSRVYSRSYSLDDLKVPKAEEDVLSAVKSSDSYKEELCRLKAEAQEIKRKLQADEEKLSQDAVKEKYRQIRQRRKESKQRVSPQTPKESSPRDGSLKDIYKDKPATFLKTKKRTSRSVSLREFESNQQQQFLFGKAETLELTQQKKSNMQDALQKGFRKMLRDKYTKVAMNLLKKKQPKNPYEYVDKKNQKIAINPKVKYFGSSQLEVLEPRMPQKWKKAPEGRNLPQIKTVQMVRHHQFLKPWQLIEQQTTQDQYMPPQIEPYKIKTQYRIKNVEQADLDEDDDDNLLLAIQPHDTCRDVGFNYFLQHAETKLYYSRSDIIVSSTMSITLNPMTEIFQTNTNDMTEEQVRHWVDRRQEFRATQVEPAKLFCMREFSQASSSDDSDQDDQLKLHLDPLQSFYLSKGGATELSKNKKKSLPVEGLGSPLTPLQVSNLSEQAQQQYMKWQGKYQEGLNTLNHRQRSIVYSLEDAKKMLAGTYDHDGSQDPQIDGGEVGQFLNRQNLGDEMDGLGAFENVIQKVMQQENIAMEDHLGKQFELINQKTAIPDDLRAEFDIADEIEEGFKLDFSEVRKADAHQKRSRPTWSGQDVISTSYDMKHSEWASSRLNSLRVWPKGVAGILKRARFLLKKVSLSDAFDKLMTLAVFLNTVVMALNQHGLSESQEKSLENSNSFFTWVFVVEFCMKIVALGPKKYVADIMNVLDGSIVMLSFVELAMGSGGGTLTVFRVVRVFRTFRVLRVTRILRVLKSMQKIMAVISRSASSFGYIVALMMIFLFIFALLGMQLYGGKLNFEDGKPRAHYDNFQVAFITSFQILTMENWNSLLYDAIKSDTNYLVSCIYFVSWIFIGYFILLNLFLAILIDSFMEDDDTDYSEEALEAEKMARKLQRLAVEKEKQRRMKRLKTMGQEVKANAHFSKPQRKSKFLKFAAGITGKKDELIDDIDELDEKQLTEYLIELNFEKAKEKKIVTFKDKGIECQNALYLFSQENWFRKSMFALSHAKWFENFVLTLIVLSSIKLAMDSYIDEKKKESIVYKLSVFADTSFTLLFTVEMVVKIISMGFVVDKGSYMREAWNQLDFFIVVTSLFDVISSNNRIGFVKVIRILRILRPLRFITHNVALKLIIDALVDSAEALLNVMLVIGLVWLMFAILAISLFGGKLFYCDQDPYLHHTLTDCVNAGGKWLRYDSNFDNMAEAMKSLFILASLEGWPDMMLQAIDATGVNQGPEVEASILYGYFFVVFIFIGSFFFLNFMIGVLVLKYTQAEKSEFRNYTREQMAWMDICHLIENTQVDHNHLYKPRHSKRQMAVWKIINASWFDYTIMAAIFLNMLEMMCSYDGQPRYWKVTLATANYVFTATFVVEAALKLYVYRRAYFYTTWNKFDFFVVAASLFDVFMELVGTDDLAWLKGAPEVIKVLRMLRTTRILRLAGKNEGLQSLLLTIQMSVMSLLNTSSLLFLIFFMFSVLGVKLFSTVLESDDIYQLQALDPNYKNFHYWHNAFMMIFVISTGENWHLVMYDVGRTELGKTCGPTTCGSKISTLFFFCFIILVQNIFLNLFVLVIIQQFELYYVADDNPVQKFKQNLGGFIKEWINLTAKQGHLTIKDSHVAQFMRNLPPPIGMPEEDVDEVELNKFIVKMGIRSEGGEVYFNEMLYRVMRTQYGQGKLNRAMTVFEISTQFRLLKLRQKHLSENNQTDSKNLLEKMKGKGDMINPFNGRMYFRITFNLWLNMARNNILKNEFQKRLFAASKDDWKAGKRTRPALLPEIEDIEPPMVEIDNETQEMVWISAPEDSSDEEQISQEDNGQKGGFEQGAGNNRRNKKMHIQKAKTLRQDTSKRFRDLGNMSPMKHRLHVGLTLNLESAKVVKQRKEWETLGLDQESPERRKKRKISSLARSLSLLKRLKMQGQAATQQQMD